MTENKTSQVFSAMEEFRAVDQSLQRLQDKLAAAHEDDWRASLAWEGVEEARHELGFCEFEACELPAKPDNFRHWRDKYTDKVLGD
jgi:hypothetical protein